MTARHALPWEAIRRHRAPLTALALASLVMGALWAGHAATRVAREDQVHYVDRWVERAWFNYSVPVVRDSPAFRAGTVLGMGEPAYFATVSPRVHVSLQWALAEPAGAAVEASGSLRAVVRSLAPDGRAYWTLDRPLSEARLAGAGGGALRLEGVLDLDAVRAEVDAVAQALGGSPGRVAWSVEARVRVQGEGSSGFVRNESVFVLPVAYDHPVFQMPGPEAATFVGEHRAAVPEVVERRAGLAALSSSPVALGAIGGGAALLALVLRSRRGDPALGPGAEAAFHRELSRYRAWVVPVTGLARPEGVSVLEVASLGDLVAVAAEARARVLLDEGSRVFYTVTPGAWFRYARHACGASLPVSQGTDGNGSGRHRGSADDGAPTLSSES